MDVRYVFSISTGRSGSDYLTELLSKATNAVSVHEGFPMMNGRPMQRFNEGDDSALRTLMRTKWSEIQKKSKNGSLIYCETNHSFIKGWGHLIPDEYIPQKDIGVIILRRNAKEIVHSLLRVHSVPGATEWSRTWHLIPGASRNLSEPLDHADVYSLCEWYINEIELRAQAYQQKYPEITYIECDLGQLNDHGFVAQMFHTLGLVPSLDLQATVGRPLNKRSEWPRLSLDELMASPQYPSSDSLAPDGQDALVADMVAYLHRHKAQEIAAIEPDYAMGGTLAVDATRIVAYAEKELEKAFQHSLLFTETEGILIYEFLRSVAPHDVFFITLTRHPPPRLSYTFDYNCVLDARRFVRKLGLVGVLKMLALMVRGVWDRDPSHRIKSKEIS